MRYVLAGTVTALVVLVLGLAVAVGAGEESPAVLLEKGVYTEEAAGDLDEAIEIYKQVLASARTVRRVAAEAQYRLGVCYEKKQEKQKAVAAFQKVIADYPDQEAFVKLARKRIPQTTTVREAVVESCMAFLGFVIEGKDDEALSLTAPGSLQGSERPEALREHLDLSRVRIAEVYVGSGDACAVTIAVPLKGREEQLRFGIGLTKHGERWLVRDIDALPNDKARAEYVQKFLERFPSARHMEPRKVTLPDVDESQVILDLASGRLIPLPHVRHDRELPSLIGAMAQGDLVYDKYGDGPTLAFFRGAEPSKKNGFLPDFPGEQVPFLVLIPPWPVQFEVTTGEGKRYTVSVLRADGKACELEYAPFSPYIGEWRSIEVTGGVAHEITAMYLDLHADGTFNVGFEGPDARAPISGTYQLIGHRLDLLHEQFHDWSLRFVDDLLRASTGGSGLVVLRKVEKEARAQPRGAAGSDISTRSRLVDLRLRLVEARAELRAAGARLEAEKYRYEPVRQALKEGRVSVEERRVAELPLREADAQYEAAREKLKILEEEVQRLEQREELSRRSLQGAIARATRASERERALRHIQSFGPAFAAYRADHRDRWPEDLEELARGGYIKVQHADEFKGYVYPGNILGALKQKHTSPQAVVMYEAYAEWPEGGVCALFADGHVEQIEKESSLKNRLDTALGKPDRRAVLRMIGPLKGTFRALLEALERGDASAALETINTAMPKLALVHASLQGTDAYEPVGLFIEKVRLMKKALEEGDLERAKGFWKGLDRMGPALEDLVKEQAK